MNATSIYNEIQAALKGGERVAVATVVKTIGAAPCGVGTKMLVRADGTRKATVARTIACNYLQILENSMDPVHLPFVHGESIKVWAGIPEFTVTRFARNLQGVDQPVLQAAGRSSLDVQRHLIFRKPQSIAADELVTLLLGVPTTETESV